MSNYFYYINDELILKFFDNFHKNKLELRYISNFRTVISSNIKLNLKMY
jgi:hypothetical protein